MSSSSNIPGIANQVASSTELPKLEDSKLFVERLEKLLKDFSSVINTKEGGLITLQELFAFKTVFTTDDPQIFRNVYRKSFDLVDLNGGNIASGATVNFAHGITDITDSILVYVSCVSTDPEYFTAVYPDVFLDNTNINFTNPHGSAVSSAIAVCEYTKN